MVPYWPKYSRSLSADVCQLRPPTKSLLWGKSPPVVFGVERPDELLSRPDSVVILVRLPLLLPPPVDPLLLVSIPDLIAFPKCNSVYTYSESIVINSIFLPTVTYRDIRGDLLPFLSSGFYLLFFGFHPLFKKRVKPKKFTDRISEPEAGRTTF